MNQQLLSSKAPREGPLSSNGHLRVNLSHLQHNLGQVQKLAPGAEVLFMVKANAYGHGLAKIVEYSSQQLGLTSFGLASLAEALELRRAEKDYHYELYVFSDLSLSQHWEQYLEHKLLPVISHMDDLAQVLGCRDCRHLPLVLHFDTGMNRLGLPLSQSARGDWTVARAGEVGPSLDEPF